MSILTFKESCEQLLRLRGCCPRCVVRLLSRECDISTKDLLELPNAVYPSPLCPCCCGLLHHPSCCTLTSNSEGLLTSCVDAVKCSNYEYLACQLKPITPAVLTIRDHVIWDWILDLATSDAFTDCSSEVVSHVMRLKREYVSAKTAWQWISAEALAASLQTPFIRSTSELSDRTLLLDVDQSLSPAIRAEHFLLVIDIGLEHPHSESECQNFCQQLAAIDLVPAISQAALNLLNAPVRTERRRSKPLNSESANSKSEPLSKRVRLDRFSKSALQSLFNLLTNSRKPLKLSLPGESILPTLGSLTLSRDCSIVIAGRYVKLSRRLPQTPWVINACRKLPSSVEELITDPVRKQFGPGTRITFASSGREDVDVRCLGLGRPFILQLDNYEKSVTEVVKSFSRFHGTGDTIGRTIDLLSLANSINESSQGKVFVRDLQIVSSEDAFRVIKQGELEKAKCYRAVCWCPGGLSREDQKRFVKLINTAQDDSTSCDFNFFGTMFGPIVATQKTPLRVLHRRSALLRKRTIQCLRFIDFNTALNDARVEFDDYHSWSTLYSKDELFLIELRCDAGTYVKEFVHGDLGRSQPSLASMIGRQVDILSLDVIAVELDWPPKLDDRCLCPVGR